MRWKIATYPIHTLTQTRRCSSRVRRLNFTGIDADDDDPTSQIKKYSININHDDHNPTTGTCTGMDGIRGVERTNDKQQIREARPPKRVEVILAHLLVTRMAGTVTRKIRMEEIPEARKEAAVLESSAWLKRRRAYFKGFILARNDAGRKGRKYKWLDLRKVLHNTSKLLHTHQKPSQKLLFRTSF